MARHTDHPAEQQRVIEYMLDHPNKLVRASEITAALGEYSPKPDMHSATLLRLSRAIEARYDCHAWRAGDPIHRIVDDIQARFGGAIYRTRTYNYVYDPQAVVTTARSGRRGAFHHNAYPLFRNDKDPIPAHRPQLTPPTTPTPVREPVVREPVVREPVVPEPVVPEPVEVPAASTVFVARITLPEFGDLLAITEDGVVTLARPVASITQ